MVDHVDVETIMVVSVADTSLTEQQLDHLLSTVRALLRSHHETQDAP